MEEDEFENIWYEYLFQALKLFEGSLNLSNDEVLAIYDGTFVPAPKGDALDQLMLRGVTARRSRHAIVFTALGAEAYINAFASEQLGKRDADALDQLRPADKWQMIPRLAFGEHVFDPGAEPLQSITQLFRRRNRLVHAKRGEWLAAGPGQPAHFADYNPQGSRNAAH